MNSNIFSMFLSYQFAVALYKLSKHDINRTKQRKAQFWIQVKENECPTTFK